MSGPFYTMLEVFEFWKQNDKWDVIGGKNASLNLLQFALGNQWKREENIHKSKNEN